MQKPDPLLVDVLNTALASSLYFANAEEERAKLLNLGTTCFANAAAQVLLRVEPFWESLKRLHLASFGSTLACHRDACECLYRQAAAFRGLEPWSRKRGTSFVSEGARHGIFGHEFTGIGKQCDALEFLWSAFVAVDGVSRFVFGLGLRTRHRCLLCRQARDMCGIQYSLSFALLQGDEPVALGSLWDDFFQEDQTIDAVLECARKVGPELARCDGCIVSQRFLEQEPPCLFIQFRRGWHCAVTRTSGKNSREVLFPEKLEFLRSGKYALRGVVLHLGDGPDCGHYVSACWLGLDGGGANVYGIFDDDRAVQRIPWQSLNERTRRNCCALLYVKEEPLRSGGDVLWSTVPYKRGPKTQLLLNDSQS